MQATAKTPHHTVTTTTGAVETNTHTLNTPIRPQKQQQPQREQRSPGKMN